MSRALDIQMKGTKLPNSLKSKEKQLRKMMAIIFLTFLMTYIPSYIIKAVSISCELKTRLKILPVLTDATVGEMTVFAPD
jgi:hypothetical protein